MKHRKLGLPVRRNVTLDGFLADHLEAAADFTGRSQGEILETALNQPIMRRLFAFTHAVKNSLVELIETYQCYEDKMTPRAGESLLLTVKEWLLEHARMRNVRRPDDFTHVNDYIRGHMTDGSMRADPYFRTVYDEAGTGTFLTASMGEKELKDKLTGYIDAIVRGPDDKNRMGESYLFRNLLVVLDDLFEPPTAEETDELFRELSDGHVLPRLSA